MQLDAFDRFWAAYPRKVGKPAALKAFARVKPDEATLAAMLRAIARQSRSEQWLESHRFIPHPSTWLNQRRWEDGDDAAPPPHEDAEAWSRLDAVRGVPMPAGRFPSRVHCRHEPRCTSDRMHALALELGRPEA